MKFILKSILVFLLLFILITSTSCSQFENLFVNLPIKKKITASGNGPTVFETELFCLSDYDAYNDNKDDIKAIKYVSAAYFTVSASAGLQGSSLSASVFRSDGVTPLFSVTLPNPVAANYINNPYKLELTQAQIAAFNASLADYKNEDCFIAELRISNVSGTGEPPYSITGQIEIVVELETTL